MAEKISSCAGEVAKATLKTATLIGVAGVSWRAKRLYESQKSDEVRVGQGNWSPLSISDVIAEAGGADTKACINELPTTTEEEQTTSPIEATPLDLGPLDHSKSRRRESDFIILSRSATALGISAVATTLVVGKEWVGGYGNQVWQQNIHKTLQRTKTGRKIIIHARNFQETVKKG